MLSGTKTLLARVRAGKEASHAGHGDEPPLRRNWVAQTVHLRASSDWKPYRRAANCRTVVTSQQPPRVTTQSASMSSSVR